MKISFLNAAIIKLHRIFTKSNKLSQAASIASIRQIVNWLSSEYNVTVHNAEVTNSTYVYILNDDNERICKIRISDHAEAFSGKDLYIVVPSNSSNYIAYLEEIRMPMIFDLSEMKSFIRHYILIKYTSKVANKCIDASTLLKKQQSESTILNSFVDSLSKPNIDLENNQENKIENDPEPEDKSYIIKVNNEEINLSIYKNKEYLKEHWINYWNSYMIKDFTTLSGITPGQRDEIKNGYCSKKHVVDLEVLNYKFGDIYELMDGKVSKTLIAFNTWLINHSLVDQKLYKEGKLVIGNDRKLVQQVEKPVANKEIIVSDDILVRYSNFINRDQWWKFFMRDYLIKIFPEISKASNIVKNNLHMAYCYGKSNPYMSLNTLDLLFKYYISKNVTLEKASNKFVHTVRTGDGYDDFLKWKENYQFVEPINIVSTETIQELIPEQEPASIEIPLNVINETSESAQNNDNESDEKNITLSKIFEYDKMTLKQKMIVLNLLEYKDIKKSDIIETINDANKYGRNIKKMRRASDKLIKASA